MVVLIRAALRAGPEISLIFAIAITRDYGQEINQQIEALLYAPCLIHGVSLRRYIRENGL